MKTYYGRGVRVRNTMVEILQAAILLLMLAPSVSAFAADQRPVVNRVAPTYPEIARRLKIAGVVRLEVTVEADGKVSDLKPVSGNHLLETAAEDAVRNWRFAPGAGISLVMVDVNFSLGD